MGTPKRERKKAARQARLEQARAQQARRHRFRLLRNLGILAAVVIAALWLFSRGDGGGSSATTSESTTTTSADGSTTTTDGDDADATPSTIEVSLPAPGAAIEGETPCPPTDGSAERTTAFAQPPPTCIDVARTYTAEVVTSEGSFTITLDDDAAPVAVNNFVVLSRYKLYDGIPFHRIIPGFVIQAGDPVGPSPGQGGPGYTIPDELPTGDAPYREGTVAMANAGPDTGGSQWFVVVGDGGQQLAPNYTVLGQVTEGIEVVRAINEHGDAASNGTPTREVVIQSITITES